MVIFKSKQIQHRVLSQNYFIKQIDREAFNHYKCYCVVEQNPKTTKRYAT